MNFANMKLTTYSKLMRDQARKRHSGIPGLWTQELDAVRWTLDAGLWTLDSGRWTLDLTFR